jgi:hypothetical protein
MLADPYLISTITREYQLELRRSADSWRMARAFRRRKAARTQSEAVLLRARLVRQC